MSLNNSESHTMEFNHDLVSYINRGKNNEAKSILQKYQYLYNLVNKSGETLLHISAKNGNSEITRYLIQCGCKVEVKDKLGMTPLMLAITDGEDDATVVALLEANADIYLTDTDQSSSLRKIVKVSQTWFTNLSGESPKKTKYFGILRAIFSKLEKEFASNEELMTERLREVDCPFALVIFMSNVAVTKYVLGAGFFLDERVGGLSAIHIAVALSDVENLKLLLEYRADVNAMDNQRQTPLFFYDKNEDHNSKQLIILKALVDHGASLTVPRSGGVTLMEYFFASGHVITLMTLVRTKTDELKKLTPDGRTALHYLARNKNGVYPVMELLLNKIKIDIDARDAEGKTALVEAVGNFTVKNVEFLIAAGVKVNLIDIFDKTVLFDKLSSSDLTISADTIVCLLVLVHRGKCSFRTKSSMRVTPKREFSLQNAKDEVFDLAKLMLKHLTLDEAGSVSVNDGTMKKIRSNSLLSDYYDSCKLELQDMKTTVVYENVTLYNLISESEEKIALYAQNQDFIEALKEFVKDNTCDNFYYFHFLQKRIDSAINRAIFEKWLLA